MTVWTAVAMLFGAILGGLCAVALFNGALWVALRLIEEEE